MKIAHISTSDYRGGAAKAAYRLHQGLLSIGIDSHFIVQEKVTDDPKVHRPATVLGKAMSKVAGRLDSIAIKKINGPSQWFSTAWVPDQLRSRLEQLQPDIVNFHWANKGFVRLETLRRLPYPIVWTLHDMWPFTGGCHYTAGCTRFMQTCGKCPQLDSGGANDASHKVLARKMAAWKKLKLQVVTPSIWMADCARTSTIFREKTIQTIPYGLDTKVYQPLDQKFARMALGLPEDRLVVLFGADAGTADPRKGFDLLEKSLAVLEAETDLKSKILLAIFGGAQAKNEKVNGFDAFHVGKLFDDASLALLYSAADVFVAPSREDNLPNTILESMACGTPCVAFRIGGMPDMIVPSETGYLATPFSPEDLAQGIKQMLLVPDNAALRARNREHAISKFGLQRQAERYVELYKSLR